MFDSLDIFRMSSAMARHASARQAVVAGNIANADTPGYRARSLPDFASVWNEEAGQIRATRPGHIAPQDSLASRAARRETEASPNGNTVSIEEEMLAGVDAQREHGRALAIWRHATGLLRTSLGR
jgi:flagellar basal-body rod protein FlgB